MFCRHKWDWYDRTVTDIYGDGFGNMTKYPVKTVTDLVGECEKCGKPRVRRIKGDWHPRREDRR